MAGKKNTMTRRKQKKKKTTRKKNYVEKKCKMGKRLLQRQHNNPTEMEIVLFNFKTAMQQKGQNQDQKDRR